MKKVLLLGGSAQQVVAIETAKRLGCYTILCDYLDDNPGQYVADKFYLESTTNKEKILEIAQKENINGILAYASDPAAPTAAYVAEKLNLPGVPFSIAESFCNKNKFRKFLIDNGFNAPKSMEITKLSSIDDIINLNYPVIIKPTDSSGSKGVTVIYDSNQFYAARDFADKYSRNGILIAEEYIERDHDDVIETEVFVINNEVVVWGVISSIRDKYTNELIPAAYSYPISISNDRLCIIKKEVCRLVKASKVENGAFNIEMLITKEDKLYFIDAGPRNGGNMLPEFIGMINDLDIPAATIYASIGEIEKINDFKLDGQEGGYWGLYVIHASTNGKFISVNYSRLAKKYLLRECLFVSKGADVKPFNNSRDAIGLAFFKFDNKNDRDEVLRDFAGKHIKVELMS